MTPSVKERAALCTSLPSLPAVALEVVELAERPDLEPETLARVVARDPALTAKLLKAANSPLYAARRKVENLRQALVLLGLNAAINMALGFSLVSGLRRHTGQGLDLERYWRRSLIAGEAARELSVQLGMGNHDELFLAAMLQDIGMLVLDQVFPQDYARLVDQSGDHEAIAAAEREAYGLDHAELGAWLMGRWRLPAFLVGAAANSHLPAPDAGTDIVFCCVAASGPLADLFLPGDQDHALAAAGAKARRLLHLEGEALASVVERISGALPELSGLFELQIADPAMAEWVVAQAKETLFLRHAKQLDDANQAREKLGMLEDRTRDLEDQTRRDRLTGLFNRAYFDDVLESEFANATQRGSPLSLAFVDLDHFKRINDGYGHQAGDHILASFAKRLASALRRTDTVARYGGEEFVVVMPGAGARRATAVLDRLRSALAEAPYDLGDEQTVHVTTSIGVATHMERIRFSDAEGLLHGADAAVYAAKRGGRNRVVAYAAEGVAG